jgi:hypothetical protein
MEALAGPGDERLRVPAVVTRELGPGTDRFLAVEIDH